MDIYLYLCILFGCSALIEIILPISLRKILFFLNGFILLIVVGGRKCGTDYWLYESIIRMDSIKEAQWPILYSFLAQNIPFQSLIFLVAIFTILPFYLLIYRSTSKYYNFGAAFFFTEFFFMTLMQQSRQGIALACIAWGILCFHNKIKTSIIMILGSSIHLTSLLGFLSFFISRKFYTLRIYILLYVISILLGGVFINFVLNNVSSVGIEILTSKLINYADRTSNIGANFNIFQFKYFLYFILIWLCYKNRKRISNQTIPYLCNLVFFSICFSTITSSIVDLAIRGGFCFSQFYLFLLLFLLEEKKIPNKHKLYVHIFGWIYSIYLMNQYFAMIIKENIDLDLIPYQFM